MNYLKMRTFGMEARFNMKRVLTVLSVAIAAMALNGCQMDIADITPDTQKQKHKLVVNAENDPDSKTSITSVANGYQVEWDIEDAIQLFECAPATEEYYWNAIRAYYSDGLAADDISDNKASFTFEIEDRTAEGAVYSYVASYGNFVNAFYEEWPSADDEGYMKWAEQFEYSGDYMEPHMLVSIEFPEYQNPTADSYDAGADIMVSDMKVTTEQLSGETSFKFARIGSIVKITLTGLKEHAGKIITEATFQTGDSYKAYRSMTYDPVLQKYAYAGEDSETSMPFREVWLNPQDLVIKEDGTADLWMRVPSGEITDWFRISIRIDGYDNEYARFVDLEELGRNVVFPESKMSEFSVGNFCIADVIGIHDITYTVNENKDGFTAVWNEVEHAAGYECFMINTSDIKTDLTATDNGDGTWSVSVENGLAADTYTLYIKPMPENGHTLNYEEYSTHTILVGIPDVWWFAHDAFRDGESVEGSEDEFIIDYSPGKVRFKNLGPVYDSSWQALKASGEWFMYSTEPLKEMHSIEIWSKDDSHLNFNVYASETPGAESLLLEGTVVETSEINAGSGQYYYNHVHKRVKYSFPADKVYQYYTIKGAEAGIVMTSQYTYVYYFK